MEDKTGITIRRSGYLPHWIRKGAIYAVQFRLYDSFPQSKLKAWIFDREDTINTAKSMGRELTKSEKKDLDFLYSEKVEKYLDAGYGACWLQKKGIARVVADQIQYFDGQRYYLLAWCIMPNHVHVVLQTIGENMLPKIIGTWKKFSSANANKLLKRSGQFWQREYYDHLIRNEQDLLHTIRYTWFNPEKAGLKEWKWRWSGISVVDL